MRRPARGVAAGHPNHAKEKSKGVKCAGVNACKGRGECGGADSSCRGMNDCKGQAWITVATKKQCADQGGKVVERKTALESAEAHDAEPRHGLEDERRENNRAQREDRDRELETPRRP